MSIKIYTFHNFRTEVEKIFTSYNIQRIAVMPSEPRRQFPKYRVCRFCEQNSTQVSFKKDAHTIPHSLGNKYDVSDFECDKCNELFSRYESDLCDFIGINRTIFGVNGKNKVPKYNSNSIKAEVKDLDFAKNSILINNKVFENITIDGNTGETKIKYTKNRYTPINVYKSFLKMALSTLPEEEVKYYKQAFDFLLSEGSNQFMNDHSLIHKASTNYDFKLHCIILKKKTPETPAFSHLFLIYFKNWIYQLFLPYNPNDRFLYDGSSRDIIFCPPLLFKNPVDQECKTILKNFNGTEKIVEEEVMSLSFDTEKMKEVKAVDPKTGEILNEEIGSSKISQVLLIPTDTLINYDDLKKINFKDL